MKEHSISCVANYVETIVAINRDDKDGDIPRRKELLFRGQCDKYYELIPSLGRYKNGDVGVHFVEQNMIEMAKYRLPEVFGDKSLEPLDLLCLLQHYGIPTRLLDLTEDALVALYFACESQIKSDGEVLIFKSYIDDIKNYPFVNAIADSYRFVSGSFCSLSMFYANVIKQPYFLEQLVGNKICHKTDEEGGKWIENCCQSPIFVHGSARLKRQEIQRGRYILFPNAITHLSDDEKGSFEQRIRPLSKDHESIIGRIIVPASAKQTIINELRLLGIKRGTLFSDSVDIVCDEIKKDFFMRSDPDILGGEAFWY